MSHQLRGASSKKLMMVQQDIERVSYRLSIHTSDVPGAGTTAHIFVTMYGPDGSTSTLSLPGVYDRATKVTNTFIAEDVGPIQRLEIGHDGFGARPKWHLSYAEVTILSGSYRNETFVFVYDDWLRVLNTGELAKVKLRTLHPSRKNVYKVIVRTADDEDAGTTRKIFIQLKGYNGIVTDQMELVAAGRKSFQPGQSDVFLVDTQETSLGKIATVDVGFMKLMEGDDPELENERWHLKSITVVYLNTGESTEFDYDKVISSQGQRAKLEKFMSRRGHMDVRDPKKTIKAAPSKLGRLVEDEAQTVAIEATKMAKVASPSYTKKSTTRENHTYRIVVVTSDVRNAGIDSRVFVTLFGRLGNTGTSTLPGEFERNSRVETTLTDVDVGEIISIRIGHDGTGLHESWHLSYVSVESVTDAERPKQLFFLNGPIRRRKAGEATEMELFPIGKSRNIYRISVRTSNIEGAGTNKLVTIRLAGRKGVITPEFELTADRNRFDQGSVDVFYLDLGGTRLGTIAGIDIGYKDAVNEDLIANYDENNLVDWHLHSVTIEHMNTGKKAEFQYNDWLLNLQAKLAGREAKLANPLEGRALERNDTILKGRGLVAALQGMKSIRDHNATYPYRIRIYTSHLPGSGTQSKVSLTLYGSLGETEKFEVPGEYREGSMVEYLLQNVEDIGGIKKVAVELDGRVFHPDGSVDDEPTEWRLSRVVVMPEIGDAAAQKDARLCFMHNGWLAGQGVVKVNLSPLHMDTQMYRITVKTSSNNQPGVSGPVTIRLKGVKGTESNEIDLTSSLKVFHSGSEDTFFLNMGGTILGKVASVDLGFKSSWSPPESDDRTKHVWHLEGVEVEHLNTGDCTPIQYSKWLVASTRPRTGFISAEDKLEPEMDLPSEVVHAPAIKKEYRTSVGIGTEEGEAGGLGGVGVGRSNESADGKVSAAFSAARERHLITFPVIFKSYGVDDDERDANEPDFQIYNNFMATGAGSDAASERDYAVFVEPHNNARASLDGYFRSVYGEQTPMAYEEDADDLMMAPPVEIGTNTDLRRRLFINSRQNSQNEPAAANRRNSITSSTPNPAATPEATPPTVGVGAALTSPIPINLSTPNHGPTTMNMNPLSSMAGSPTGTPKLSAPTPAATTTPTTMVEKRTSTNSGGKIIGAVAASVGIAAAGAIAAATGIRPSSAQQQAQGGSTGTPPVNGATKTTATKSPLSPAKADQRNTTPTARTSRIALSPSVNNKGAAAKPAAGPSRPTTASTKTESPNGVLPFVYRVDKTGTQPTRK